MRMKSPRANIAALGLSIALAASYAFCAPPDGIDENSPMAKWYRSLQTPEGGSCCSVADCRPVVAELVGDHWEIVPKDGPRIPVPPNKVLHHTNMDGRPIACLTSTGDVRCFVPPAGA